MPAGSRRYEKRKTLARALEGVLQRELNDARADRRGVNDSEGRAGGVRIGIAELWMVESVEKFGAELQRLRLVDSDEFRERHIPVVLARPAHEAKSCVT